MSPKVRVDNYIKNFCSQFVVNSLSQCIALFAIPYAARTLGSSKFGEYNLAASFAMFALILPTFGFTIYASRQVSRIDNVNQLVNATTTLKFLLSLLALTVMCLLGVFLHKSSDFFWVALLCGLSIVAQSFDMSWVFIAKEMLRKVGIYGLYGQILMVVCLMSFVRSPEHLPVYAIIQSFPILVPALLSFVLYLKVYGMFRLSLSYERWNELSRESIPLGITGLTATLNVYVASIIIGLQLTVADLGNYSAGFKLMMAFNVFFNLISTVVSPTIARLYVESRDELLRILQMYLAVCIVIGCSSAFFLFFLSDWLVMELLGIGYVKTILLMKVWALGLLPLTPLSIFSVSSLIACNASKYSTYAILLGSCVSLTSIAVLLRVFGVIGAPISQVLMELCVCVTSFLLIKKHLRLNRSECLRLINLRETTVLLINAVRKNYWLQAKAKL